MFLLTFLFVLLSFYWRERLKYLLSMSFPTIATWLSIKSLLTLIIVKDPTCLWNLCFGSVLLRYTSNSFPGTSYGSRLSLGFFIFLLLLSGALLKVWCRQSKVNRLFNLFLPCQETLNCEITEQKLRLRRLFKNSHRTSRCWQQPQPSPWQRPLWAPEYKHGDKRVNQAWPYKKKTTSPSQEGTFESSTRYSYYSDYSNHSLKASWRSQQNKNIATRSLIAEAKMRKKLAWLVSDITVLMVIFLFSGEPVKNKPVSWFVSWSSSLLHLRQIFCFCWLSPTWEAAVANLQSPQTNVFSGLWRNTAQRRCERWALTQQIFVPQQTRKP